MTDGQWVSSDILFDGSSFYEPIEDIKFSTRWESMIYVYYRLGNPVS